MTFWKNPGFKALQKTWYKHLEDSGFKDAEMMVDSRLTLKESACKPYRKAPEVIRETREAYYNILAQKIQEAEFIHEIDKLILTWHADGMKAVSICIELQAIGVSLNRNTIRYRIRRYEAAWGIREYTPRQLNRMTPKS